MQTPRGVRAALPSRSKSAVVPRAPVTRLPLTCLFQSAPLSRNHVASVKKDGANSRADDVLGYLWST